MAHSGFSTWITGEEKYLMGNKIYIFKKRHSVVNGLSNDSDLNQGLLQVQCSGYDWKLSAHNVYVCQNRYWGWKNPEGDLFIKHSQITTITEYMQ